MFIGNMKRTSFQEFFANIKDLVPKDTKTDESNGISKYEAKFSFAALLCHSSSCTTAELLNNVKALVFCLLSIV